MSKTRALCVIAGSKHLYSLMLSSVSWCLGTRDEALALVLAFYLKVFPEKKEIHIPDSNQILSTRQSLSVPSLRAAFSLAFSVNSLGVVSETNGQDTSSLLEPRDPKRFGRVE